MRILRVAQKSYPDANGGGPYHVHAMSRDQAKMGHDVTVVTVRTDPERQAAELGIDDDVNFLGHVPYDEMPAMYWSGDVLVLPSRSEGVPRSVLAAIASGVPAVCSRLTQLRELLEGREALVGTESGSAFAESLEEWIAFDRPVEPVDERYAWDSTVDQATDHLNVIAH
ncbi:glycosyltransferase family 4 protein [Halostagnicola bangensis]